MRLRGFRVIRDPISILGYGLRRARSVIRVGFVILTRNEYGRLNCRQISVIHGDNSQGVVLIPEQSRNVYLYLQVRARTITFPCEVRYDVYVHDVDSGRQPSIFVGLRVACLYVSRRLISNTPRRLIILSCDYLCVSVYVELE